MPTDTSLNPFKPQEPRIPGVPAEKREKSRTQAPGVVGPPPSVPVYSPSRMRLASIALTLLLALGAGFHAWMHWSSRKNAPSAVESMPATAKTIAEVRPKAADAPVIAPGVIATRAQLSKPWSSKRFYFRDPVTQQPTPAIVVRLPVGTFWALSLREPFGQCQLEYITDLKKLKAQYDFSASHPMAADPCNGSVFDLTRYSSGPSGLVRGEIEKGTALRPPTAIEVRTRGNEIVAVRMEQ
ncbi:MAG TPA: hypothetical protein VNE63_10225 [Candidatus Acidoferrales bacterium]|nr:hypothetical protein [Candidatus Acidoferrales bacterium]